MDRVVFGPCRMLCLYLTQPLTVDEKSKLTYSYAFREFTSEGAGDDGAMTPERQALVDSINEIKQDIAQANIIGAEMCTTLTFRIQVCLVFFFPFVHDSDYHFLSKFEFVHPALVHKFSH